MISDISPKALLPPRAGIKFRRRRHNQTNPKNSGAAII
jgi:hypothetical protein